MIYVCVSSSFSSSLCQPRANALIRLPTDCRGGKKCNNRSSRPAWGSRVNHEGGGFHIHPAFLFLFCSTTQPDSYEGKEWTVHIKPLVSRRINVSQWKTPHRQGGLSKSKQAHGSRALLHATESNSTTLLFFLQAFEELFMMWGHVYMHVILLSLNFKWFMFHIKIWTER